jgi:hypothetical protein
LAGDGWSVSRQIVLVGLLAALPHCTGAQEPVPPKAPSLLVQASLSTAGPYGENWYLTLTPDGGISLQVFYSTNPSGNLMARFTGAGENLETLRKAIEAARFFDLPAEISPKSAPLHRPHFRLDITLSGRQHQVSLYDPGQLQNDDRARRFLVVWNRLFESLPLKPSWK